MLTDHILELPKRELLNAFVYLIGAVVAIWVLFNAMANQLGWFISVIRPDLCDDMEEMGVKVIFTDLVFPLIFMNSCVKFFKKMTYIW